MKPAPKTAKELKTEAASLKLQRNNINTKPRRELIRIIKSSKEINRQIGHATILLFGPSGSGKSSTINHVFNQNHNFATTSDEYSATRNITEYNITNDYPIYDVKDVSLGVIDSPGLGDTEGIAQDACNLVAIKNFFHGRKKVFPNLIFVVVNAGDARFDGTNSHLSNSLKCLQKLELVDKKNPNVIGVITHTGGFGQKKEKWISKFEERRERLKKLIWEQLKVMAEVVALENKPDDHELENDGDYTILPDEKTTQPRNLYRACSRLLNKNGDEFGSLAINSAYIGSIHTPKVGSVQKPKDANKEELGMEESKFMKFCQQAIRGEEISDGNSSSEDDDDNAVIAKTSEDKKVFNDNDDDNTVIAKESDNKKILDNCKSFLAVGYDIILDETLPDEIFVSKSKQNEYGILIPDGAKFSKCSTYKSFKETYSDKKEKIQKKMERHKIGVNVISPDFNQVGAQAGAKNEKKNIIIAASKEFSYIEEHRLFQAEIEREKLKSLPFTNGFKTAVADLPNNLEHDDKFEEFFETWGCYVIAQAFIGGSIEVTVNTSSDSKEKNDFKGLDLGNEISALLTAGVSVGTEVNEQTAECRSRILESCRVLIKGGDESLHSKSTLRNQQKMQEWRESIRKNPVMLNSKLTLIPISKYVGSLNQEKESLCNEAMKRYVKNKQSNRRVDDVVEIEKKTRGCFAGSATVQKNKDGVLTDIEMTKLAVGDLIKTKKGFSKVLLFAHYAPNKIHNYVKIVTVDGHCLRLTGDHLIFVSSDKHTKLAHTVQPGDKLISQDKEKTCEVVSVEEVTEVGLFCPITEDGTIYVDGILTSCYASCKPFFNIDAHHLAHLGLLPMRIVNMKSGQVEEMHPYIKFLDELPLPFRM